MAAYPQFGQPTALPPSQLLSVGKPGGSNTSSPEPGPRSSLAGAAPPSLPAAPTAPQSPYAVPYNPALLAYPRLPGLSESMYGASLAGTQGIYSLGTDPAAFYVNPITGTPYDLKDNAEIWRNLAQPTACLPYDPATLAAYPYAGYGGIDLSLAARRKNATKENTSTLKAWLNEHKKNPYPTKGEKIMLAIITKMTLTQVSTWFANARRRLKKENKMTWSPKSKEDGSDDEGDNEDSAEVRGSDPMNGDRSPHAENSRDNDHTQVDVLGDSDDEAEDNNLPRPSSAERLSMEQMKTSQDNSDHDSNRGRDSPMRKDTDCGSEATRPSSPTQRPRIWSLDDVLGPTRSSSPPGSEHMPSAPAHTTSTLPFPLPLKPTVTSLGLSHTAASLRHWADRGPYSLPAGLASSLAHPYSFSAAVFSSAGRAPTSAAFPGLSAAGPHGLHPAVSMAAGLGGPTSSLHVPGSQALSLRPGENYPSQASLRNGLVSLGTPLRDSDSSDHSPPPALTAFRPVNRSKPADVVKV